MGRKTVKSFIVSILLFLFIILFIIIAMFSIFDKVTQSIKEFFNFGDGVTIANAEKLEELMNSGYTFEDGYEDYLNNNVKVYIDKEKKGYLENIAAKKVINTDGAVTVQDIMLNMSEQKYSYCAPWQLFMLVDFFSDNDNFGKVVNNNVEKAYEVFAPKFYGLKDIKGDFKYYAIKTVTVTHIVKRKVDRVWHESTFTTTTTEKTPLPYFDRIEAYDNTYDFNYKIEEDTNTTRQSSVTSRLRTTTITNTYTSIPVLKNTNVTSNADSFYSNLCSLIGTKNVSEFAECYSFLPINSRLSLLLSELSYKGTIGTYSGVGMIAGGDYTLPSIILSNNTSVSKTEFIKVATSILGLPYFWGGKYHQNGINPNWWKATYCSSGGSSMSNGTWPLGLDCSGYVDWIFTQFGISVGSSTSIIYQNGKSGVLTRVSKSDLQIGDIGLDYGSESIDGNHTGVVIGFENGTPLIAHAGGSRYYGGLNGQVVVSPLSEVWNASHPVRFYAFYRVNGLTWK